MRIDREIGPKGYDPYNSADRDAESALEWRWAVWPVPEVATAGYRARQEDLNRLYSQLAGKIILQFGRAS